MYEIRPESVKTFVEDTSIKLPRFQRKQTWDDKKNFELCISVFKGYPMGVCILNIERDSKGKTSKWLLDGRQRRNALMKIWEDPENIYIWAKKWISLKNNDQISDVEEKFWMKINDYLEEDELNNDDSNGQENEDNDKIEDDTIQNLDTSDDVNVAEDTNFHKADLELLIEIIKLVHNKTNKYSGFTRPFDFTKIINNLPYESSYNDGSKYLNSRKLMSFISEYASFCRDENLDEIDQESFKSFFTQRFQLGKEDIVKLSSKINLNWSHILKRMDLIEKIRSLLISAKIGLIEVKDIQLTDSQKIFNIINSKGTKLNAVEILSAKPSWNIRIENPTIDQQRTTNEIYSKIQIKSEDVVKWDISASLMLRLTNANTFFMTFSDTKTDFEKQITLGFKMLSGIFQRGVKKENIDDLGKNKNINWNTEIDGIINDINLLTRLILSFDYFKYFKSWQGSIINILSDSISLNFLLVMYEDWKRKGKPIGNDKRSKAFQKNSFILIDKLVYEYVTKQWRGSSDAKISQNIKAIDTEDDLFSSISKSKWAELINGILDSNLIEDEKISQGLMTPLLYHFYCTRSIQGPDTDCSIEVDHIVPQSIFKSSTLNDKDTIQHNLYNLALLPKNENCSKSNKRLVEINNQWLKDQILKYEFIEESEFQKFSDLINLDELKDKRSKFFKEDFISDRERILIN
ncbi:MAG: DUF262 domain-containing protein [Candidatus Delongbacteria bacterium]